MTEVYFLWEKPVKGVKASVFAYFPTIQHNSKLNTCYAHIGQHSACDRDYANSCKQANFNEYYRDLLPELISIGYRDLRILNGETFSYWRKPTPEEIRFGNGEIHHYVARLKDCINPKTGKIKKWLIGDDGLRYYYS
jgi:hypothetical protein